MGTKNKIAELEQHQIIEELIQCQDALEGLRKSDFFIFYSDKTGRGRVLFLDNLRHFPFNPEKEIKILLSDAIDHYFSLLNNSTNE